MNFWREVSGATSTKDRKAEGTDEKTYKLSLASPGAVLPSAVVSSPTSFLNENLQPLPAQGSPHPTLPGFVLDRYDASYEAPGSSVIIIRGLYSNSGRYTLPTTKTNIIGELRWANAHNVGAFDWVYAESEPRSVPNALGGVDTVRVWVIKHFRFQLRQETMTAEIRLEEWTAANRAAVRNQVGKIHFFDSRWWRFMGADADQEADKQWRITYSWEGDPGHTINPWAGKDPTKIWFEFTSAPFPPDNTNYVRKPFHNFVPYWDMDDVQERPKFDEIPIHAGQEAAGHLSLPGVN